MCIGLSVSIARGFIIRQVYKIRDKIHSAQSKKPEVANQEKSRIQHLRDTEGLEAPCSYQYEY